MKGLTEPWSFQGGQSGHNRYCGNNVRCWEEAGGCREDSGLGHGAGLLLVDVAAHATSVDAWKNQRDSRGWVRGEQRGRERPYPGGLGCLDQVLIQVWRIIVGEQHPLAVTFGPKEDGVAWFVAVRLAVMLEHVKRQCYFRFQYLVED